LSNSDFDAVFDELSGGEGGRTVLIAVHYTRFPADLAEREEFIDDFYRAVQVISSNGNTVIILKDVPRFSHNPESCIVANMLNKCSMLRDHFEDETKNFDQALEQVSADTSVRVLSLADALCDANYCSMFFGSNLYYRDNNHLNIPGSRLVGRHLASMLKDGGGTE
jgi:hypothetical protein